jgi:hypothetical protein
MDREDIRHIFDRDERGTKLANNASEVGPQRSLRMSEAIATAGGTVALAGPAASDAVDGAEVVDSGGSDVISNSGIRPSPGEMAAPPFVGLDEPGVIVSCLREPGI